MEPITIAAIALGGTGLGLQMKAAHEQGKALEAQAKSEAAWQEYNAQIAEREAKQVQEEAAFEERKHRKEAERLKARQRTQLGKAGILPIGTAELVMKETGRELEIDALRIRRSGQIGARALTAEAQLSRFAGRSALLRGRAKKRAGRMGAFATGVSGAAQLTFAATE